MGQLHCVYYVNFVISLRELMNQCQCHDCEREGLVATELTNKGYGFPEQLSLMSVNIM